MSFVRNIFNKMSASEEKDIGDVEDSDSEDTSTESEDTGIFTAVNSLSDFENAGHVEADCSAISNFFGYWYVGIKAKQSILVTWLQLSLTLLTKRLPFSTRVDAWKQTKEILNC